MAMRGAWFKILAVVLPLIALLTAWPLVREMPPIMVSPNFNSVQVLLVVPFYLGLLAGPGYLYALFSKKQTARPPWIIIWERWSLNAAIVASIGGLTTVLAVIPLPFVLGSLCLSILLRRDLKRFC